MSYLQDIEPYIDRVKLQQEGKGAIRNREIMVKIAEIHFKYIHSKDFPTMADIGCRTCVGRMLNQLVGLYDTEVIKLFKELSTPLESWDSPVIKTKGSKMTFPKQEKPCPTIDVTKLSWGKFKKYCKGKGLNVVGKTKVELLKELNEQ